MRLGTFMMPLHPPKRQPHETYPEDREAGAERQRLAAQTIVAIKRILTPAQVKAIRFEAP